MSGYKIAIRGVYWDNELGDSQADKLKELTYRENTSTEQRPSQRQQPSSYKERINPYTGRIKFGAQDLSFHRNDLEKQLFEARNSTFDDTVATDISPGDTAIELNNPSTWSDRDIIHVNQETIKLGTYNSSNGQFENCTRDARGFKVTNEGYHGAGDPVFGDKSGGVPYWRNRILRSRIPGTSTSWYGVIQSITWPNPTQVDLRVNNYYSSLIGSKVGRGDHTISRREHSWNWRRKNGKTGISSLGYLGSDQYKSSVRKDDDTSKNLAIQLAGALWSEGWTSTTYIETPGHGSQRDVSDQLDDGETVAPVEEDAYEVALFGAGNAGAVDPLFASNVEDRKHPISILRVLLESSSRPDINGYDILSERWGMGLSTSGTAEQTHPDVEIDQLVLGWDGEGKTFGQLIRQLAVGFGFVPVLNDGELDFKRFGAPTIDQGFTDLTVEPGPISWDEGLDRQTSEIEVVRQGWPWDESRSISIDTKNDPSTGGASRGQWADKKKWTYEYPTLSPRNSDSDAWPYVRGEMISRIVRSQEGRPVLTVETQNRAIEPGTWVKITDLPVSPEEQIVDGAGNLVEITQSNPLYGWVKGRRLETGGVNELEILVFLQELVKLRGPSMICTATNADNDKAYTDTVPDFGSYDRSTGDSIPDSETFDPEMTVQIHHRNLKVASTTEHIIVGIGEDDTGPYIQINSSWAVDPTNKVLRVSHLSDYTTPDKDQRKPIYVAANNGVLAKGTSNEQSADLYGR